MRRPRNMLPAHRLRARFGAARARTRASDGFTLVELLVVMVIISILMAVAIAQLRSAKVSSRINATKSVAGQVDGAIGVYLSRHPKLPSVADPLLTAGTWTSTQGATSGGLYDVDATRLLRNWPDNPYTGLPLVINRVAACPAGGTPGQVFVCRPPTNPAMYRVVAIAQNSSGAAFVAYDHSG